LFILKIIENIILPFARIIEILSTWTRTTVDY